MRGVELERERVRIYFTRNDLPFQNYRTTFVHTESESPYTASYKDFSVNSVRNLVSKVSLIWGKGTKYGVYYIFK